MNFTREPLIETIITPKDGYKLVVRNSKGGGQEEFFVDAIEVISFGNSCFFRSMEKPKCFIVPVSDYEILEVRETRMLLKTASMDRGIKIAGGREALLKPSKELKSEEELPASMEAEVEAPKEEAKTDKRRERRRYRKKRGGKADYEQEQEEEIESIDTPFPEEERKAEKPSLIPPPSTLISETLSRYKLAPIPAEPISREVEAEEELPPTPSVDKNDEETPF